MKPLVGVFALQGDFERHAAAWRRAGADVREVRTRADFEGLDALSMPGQTITSGQKRPVSPTMQTARK